MFCMFHRMHSPSPFRSRLRDHFLFPCFLLGEVGCHGEGLLLLALLGGLGPESLGGLHLTPRGC